MKNKITKEALKAKLNKDYQKVSTDGGATYRWTCSALSHYGTCVDVIDDGDFVETIKIDSITNIDLYYPKKGYAIHEIMKD